MAKKRQKSKLVKLMNSDEITSYETTVEDCQFWFKVLNEEVFNGSLLPLDEIDIRWRRGCHAYYACILDDTNGTIVSKLCMNKRYKTMQFFVEVLAHELIHHHQAIYNEPVRHGPSFLAWRDKFNKKGINLSRVYVEDEA